MRLIAEGQEVILLEDRLPDCIYDINNGMSQAYQFVVPANGQQIITIQHIYEGAQDSSILSWFSEYPFGPHLFAGKPDLEWFKVPRATRVFEFWDQNLQVDDFKLFPNKIYWINFQNLQNQPNQFRVCFSE